MALLLCLFTFALGLPVVLAVTGCVRLRTLRQAVLLSEDLVAITDEGASLVEGARALEYDSKGRQRKVIGEIRSQLEDGGDLASALQNARLTPLARIAIHRPRLFSQQHIAAISISERHNVLSRVMPRLAAHQRALLDFTTGVVGNLVYPAAVAVFVFILFVAMGVPVRWSYQKLFTKGFGGNAPDMGGPVLDLPHYGWALCCHTCLLIAEQPSFPWLMLALGAVLLAYQAVKRQLKPRRTGPLASLSERVLYLLPVYGGYARRMGLARFAQLMDILLDAEVPLPEALAASEQGLPPPLAGQIRRVRQAVVDGESLTAALRHARFLTPTFRWFVSVGESSNRLASAFEQLAHIYLAEAGRVLSIAVRIVAPIAILMVGIVEGAIVLSLFTPIVQIAGAIEP